MQRLTARLIPMAAVLAVVTAGTFYAQDHAGASAKEAHAAKPDAPEIFCGHKKTGQLCPGNVVIWRAASRTRRLAERLQASPEIVDHILDGWPGVFSDSERRIVGYWGHSIAAAYTGPHQLTIDGRKLSAWCAWDTLFLPELLGKPVEVESRSPGQGGAVKLIVTPTGVDHVEPEDAHVSFRCPMQATDRRT